MPLYKKSPKKGKKNQGAQWGNTGDAGNIKKASSTDRIAGGPMRPATSSRHGRDQSIGRSSGKRRKRK